MKKVIPIISALLLLGLFYGFYHLNTKTQYLPSDTRGNSSGNLLNGGLFCEQDGKIYFSNPVDNGALYVMNSDCTNVKKLREESVSSINVAGKYIFYAKDNNNSSKKSNGFLGLKPVGVYRVNKKDGKQLKQLYEDPAGVVALYGNHVYYQRYDEEDGLSFFKIGIDNQNSKEISPAPYVATCFQNDTLFFTGIEEDHNINTMNLKTNTMSLLSKGNYSNLILSGDYLYYLDLSQNYAIGRMELDGSNPTILVEERCSFYNLSVSGKYLYYQVDDTKNNGLYKMDLVTKKKKNLIEGDYHSIHTTSNYVFFQDFHTSQNYMITSGDEDNIKTFHPPDITH